MKKYLLSLFAVMLAVAFSAFSVQKSSKVDFAEYWYELIPNGNPADPMDYFRVGDAPCGGTSSNICGVLSQQFSISDIEHPTLPATNTSVYKP